MITIIFGKSGAGKTSLMTHFMHDVYFREGNALLKKCIGEVTRANETRKTPLTPPTRPPIYADFEVRLHVGFEKWYTPYFINGFYFGFANENMATQYILPYGRIFLSEAQRYFDSRKSGTFPRFAANAFEMHRHYGLDIWMDVQRVGLIDLNIRELCQHFIEVQSIETVESKAGNTEGATWSCREFDCLADVEQYLKTGDKLYRETVYRHDGDIFGSFNSRGHAAEFFPPDGKDFNNLRFLHAGELPAAGTEEFYRTGEPKGYRGMPSKKKEASS